MTRGDQAIRDPQSAIRNLSGVQRAERRLDVAVTLVAAPLAVAGLVWLATVTEWRVFREEWPVLLLVLFLLWLFRRFEFRLFAEIRMGQLASFTGSLDIVLIWSAVLVWGPSVLWLALLLLLYDSLRVGWRDRALGCGWGTSRNLTLEATELTLINLAALLVYRRLGGVVPFAGLIPGLILPALVATLLRLFLSR
ncbi:MAG: hypothetical protein ACRDIB_01015, partial [Ardenticatenaceae bacterium]